MFEFGKSLMTMNPEEQKSALKNATGAQRSFASEVGIGMNGKYGQNRQRQQQRQQKRGVFHDLERLNHVVEKENEAHDFFGGLLGDWQKDVTGKSPSKGATNLKSQFDDYEHGILSELPKGGKRHSALSESLPKIKDGFLKQGHQFALDKLNERSRSVLGNGLKRIAKDALGARTDEEFQQHDNRAAGLINKYVLSEAKFDEKDADVFYDQFLKDAGVPSEAELAEQDARKAASVGTTRKIEGKSVELLSAGNVALEKKEENVEGKTPDVQGEALLEPSQEQGDENPGEFVPKSSAQYAHEMEAKVAKPVNSTEAARLLDQWEKQSGNSVKDVEEHYKQKLGSKPTWIKDELGKSGYYEKRAKDFEERNPGKKAPEYYREYGDKYVKRFDKLKPELSEKGQKWLEKTKDLLQFRMESGLRSGEWDESKPEELKKKAYDSHSEAYLEAGLADLPQGDIDKVVKNVDTGDMWDLDAFLESLEVGKEIWERKGLGKAVRTAGAGALQMIPQHPDAYDQTEEMLDTNPYVPKRQK